MLASDTIALPVESGRVMTSYEVRFVPLGGGGEQVFRTAAELVRIRGEWRIGRPIGEVSLPDEGRWIFTFTLTDAEGNTATAEAAVDVS